LLSPRLVAGVYSPAGLVRIRASLRANPFENLLLRLWLKGADFESGVQRIVVRLGGCFRRPPDALVAIISTSPPEALRHDRTRAAGGYRCGRRYCM
jgi:hypothetical protein